MGYAGEVYAGWAEIKPGTTTTFEFMAGNIGGTSLIIGEFTVSAAACAVGAETGVILVPGTDISVYYAGPNQGDWPPTPPGTYYGSLAPSAARTLFVLSQPTLSNEGGE
jgi:hypothetical protein